MLRLLVVVVVVVVVVALLAASGCHGFGIFSLNIANYNDHPNWSQRLVLIADAIAAAQPDLIAFQEPRFDPDYPTTRTLYQNAAEQVLYNLNQRGLYFNARIVTQPVMFYPVVNSAAASDELDKLRAAKMEELAARAPERVAHVSPLSLYAEESPFEYPLPAQYAPNNQTQYWEGLTVIARDGIAETGTRFLTKTAQCSDANLRGTQYVYASVAGTPVYLFNTHFGLDATCQLDNTKETLAYMQTIGGSDAVKILVGDLNAVPTDAAPTLLAQSGFVDVWSALRPGQPGYTHPSNAPTSRIDYVWVASASAKLAVSVNQTCTQPNAQGIYCSDHLGLFAVFN